MTFDEFRASARAEATPGDLLSDPLKALWYDARGEWDRAHEIAQGLADSEGARIHAYLHRKEGDRSNARYWYGRAGVEEVTGGLDQEWEALVVRYLASGG